MAKHVATPKPKRGRPPSVDHTPAPRMTGKQFTAWQAALGLTDSQAARILGTAPSSIARYREKGGRHWLGLACAAIAAGLPSWKPAR